MIKLFSLVIQSYLQIIHVELISKQEFYSETFSSFFLNFKQDVYRYFKFILICLTFLFLFFLYTRTRSVTGCSVKRVCVFKSDAIFRLENRV